ncbi:hypothetical protein, partial [Burkholderia stabilis]
STPVAAAARATAQPKRFSFKFPPKGLASLQGAQPSCLHRLSTYESRMNDAPLLLTRSMPAACVGVSIRRMLHRAARMRQAGVNVVGTL